MAFTLRRSGFTNAKDFSNRPARKATPAYTPRKTCCVWSGQSWPYATAQTLKAMANLLQDYRQDVVTKADYNRLLAVYARTQWSSSAAAFVEVLQQEHRPHPRGAVAIHL